MTKLMITVLTGLFVMSLGSVSLAGMMDKLTGKTDEAKQEASEKMENKEAAGEKSIEAKDATKEESGGMMDKAKETAEDTAKEKLGGLGK